MRGYLFLLLCSVILLACTTPAQAINLFGRHPKADPQVRVPQLLITARTAPQERQRLAAVEELRQYDAAAFPQIVPVLIELLRSDPSAAVRAEAAYSLGRLRPASAEVSQALKAALHDPALRVRWQARSALMFYPTPPASSPAALPSAATRLPTGNSGPPLVGTPLASPMPAPPHYSTSSPVPRGTPEPPPASTPPAEIARPLPRGPETPPTSAVPPPVPAPAVPATRGGSGGSQTGTTTPMPMPAVPAGPLDGPELPPP